MEWSDLRVILATYRGRTLVRAAAELNVAHTTVSRRLARVESDLGVRLFDRTPGGLVPTDPGHDVIQTALQVEKDIQQMRSRVMGLDQELRGPLTVSTVDITLACFGDSIASFIRRYPNIDLTLSISREVVSLARREADVVLRVSSAPPETLVGRSAGSMQFGVYAARSLVTEVGSDAPLGAYPWIGWGGGPHVRWFESWLADNAPGASQVVRLDDRGVLMLHAVRAGLGAQLLPCILADTESDLVRIAPLDPTFRVDIWLLTLPALRRNERVRAFLTHMADALAGRREALLG